MRSPADWREEREPPRGPGPPNPAGAPRASVASESEKISVTRPGASGMSAAGVNATAAVPVRGSDCAAMKLRCIGALAAAGPDEIAAGHGCAERRRRHGPQHAKHRLAGVSPAARRLPGWRRRGRAPHEFEDIFRPRTRGGLPFGTHQNALSPLPRLGRECTCRARRPAPPRLPGCSVSACSRCPSFRVMVELGQPWHEP